jgi:hypothetical protein
MLMMYEWNCCELVYFMWENDFWKNVIIIWNFYWNVVV